MYFIYLRSPSGGNFESYYFWIMFSYFCVFPNSNNKTENGAECPKNLKNDAFFQVGNSRRG